MSASLFELGDALDSAAQSGTTPEDDKNKYVEMSSAGCREVKISNFSRRDVVVRVPKRTYRFMGLGMKGVQIEEHYVPSGGNITLQKKTESGFLGQYPVYYCTDDDFMRVGLSSAGVNSGDSSQYIDYMFSKETRKDKSGHVKVIKIVYDTQSREWVELKVTAPAVHTYDDKDYVGNKAPAYWVVINTLE